MGEVTTGDATSRVEAGADMAGDGSGLGVGETGAAAQGG